MKWRRLGGMLIPEALPEAVEDAIIRERQSGNHLSLCIGTDSTVRGHTIEYATVIVFLRKGLGGYMYINTELEQGPISIKERMMNEVTRSIGIAYQLSHVLEKYSIPVEIHADINAQPQHKSHQAYQDAMGYILGMGYIFKAKPFAFASTSCANKVL